MKCILLLSFIVVIYVSSCKSLDLIVGTNYNALLLWHEKVEYMAFPLKKRVKEVFYSDPAQTIIKGIVARDLDHTAASASITAGGVGHSFVNIRFKSERGGGLNYQFEVYA